MSWIKKRRIYMKRSVLAPSLPIKWVLIWLLLIKVYHIPLWWVATGWILYAICILIVISIWLTSDVVDPNQVFNEFDQPKSIFDSYQKSLLATFRAIAKNKAINKNQ